MPHWEGIEDASAVAEVVWLERRKRREEEEEEGSTDGKLDSSSRHNNNKDVRRRWKPLRKSDCRALNRARGQRPVLVEGGRATADPVRGTITYNFFRRGAVRELVSARWFVREEKGGGSNREVVLHPISSTSQDSEKIEAFYQRAVQAQSSLGSGISSLLQGKEEVLLENSTKDKVVVHKAGDTLTMRKIGSGWFASPQLLQRGYGEYEVEGEENEILLGPVRHLFFVIHGIGENMFHREDINFPGYSLVDSTNEMRMQIQRKQVQEWKKQCAKADADSAPPRPPDRIELIPIEWFSAVHDSSSALVRSLQAVTLPTIPALRALANDVVFDVLLYLTPAFSQAVLECVTEQINEMYGKFQEVHPDFLHIGGTCSLAGHSLGSVICWDLLSILKDSQEHQQRQQTPSFLSWPAYGKGKEDEKKNNHTGTWCPTLTRPMDAICFTPESTLFLGSPLGIFLTLRGAPSLFDELRLRGASAEESDRQDGKADATPGIIPAVSPFTLPSKAIYNIFHPSDPVAYRIEPLLLSPNLRKEDLPPAMFLTVPGKDVRFHIKAKQIQEKMRKSLFEPQKSGWGSLIESAVSALGADGEATSTPTSKREALPPVEELAFPLGGKSNRVDYSLQTGVIDNEYISAVLAHSSYFSNADVQDFLISLGHGTTSLRPVEGNSVEHN